MHGEGCRIRFRSHLVSEVDLEDFDLSVADDRLFGPPMAMPNFRTGQRSAQVLF